MQFCTEICEEDVGGRVYNITMDFKELGWGGMDRIDLVQDRDRWNILVSMVMIFRVP
jgi:hypothetical protein